MDAQDLLASYNVTDGLLHELSVRPNSIVLTCDFHSIAEGGKWTGKNVRITLDRHCQTKLSLHYPASDFDQRPDELGDFHVIDADGPVDSASFRLETTFVKIAVQRCRLQISDL